MIETFLNGIELLVTGGCMIAAIYLAFVSRSRIGMMLAMFCGAFFLGQSWWLLYLVMIRKDLPNSLIPYIDWFAAWLFLIIMLQLIQQNKPVFVPEGKSWLPWVAPVFTAGMAVFYMQWGAYFNNAITAALMGILMWKCIRGLQALRGTSGAAAAGRPVYRTVLIFCLLEYAAWTASCFDYDHPLRSLYSVFSLLLPLSIIPIILSVRKAVDALRNPRTE